MPIIKHKGQRIAVFIDTQNLYHSARNLYQSRVNFNNILKDAVAGRTLVRAIAYMVNTEAGDEKNFLEALSKMGIEVKTKDLQIFAGGAKKADWDVGLAVDAVKIAHRVDTIVIVSGDGDFVPLVEYLKVSAGNQVEVMSFGKSTSGRLREIADDFIDLSANPRKYLLNHGATRRPYRTRAAANSANHNPETHSAEPPATL